MNSEGQLTLSQIVSAILRHKIKALVVASLVMLMVMVLFVIWPREYGSEGRLYVQRGGNNSGISPIVTNSGVMVQDSHENEIRSVMEIIKSRAVAERVVDTVGVEAILESPFDGIIPSLSLPSFLRRSSGASPQGMTPEEVDRAKRREVAVSQFHDNLSVYNEKQTSVISVYIKGNSPQLATQMVQEIFDETRKIYLSVHSVKESTEFFKTQVIASEASFAKALHEQEKFRNDHKFLSVGSARNTLDNIISELEQQVIAAEVDLESSEKSVAKLGELLKGTEPQIAVPTSGVEKKSYEEAQAQLFQAEASLDELIAQLSLNHPRVKQQQQTIEKLRRRAGGLSKEHVESALKMNPVFEELKVEMARAEANYVAAQARLQSLNEKYKAHSARLESMNNHEVVAQQLANKVETARQEWELFKNKGIEAMATGKLDESPLSSVVVVQSPNWVLKPVSPKASIFLPLGAILSVLAGLAVALFLERNHLSASLNEGDVEQILGMPVLVTLPRVYSSRNMVS